MFDTFTTPFPHFPRIFAKEIWLPTQGEDFLFSCTINEKRIVRDPSGKCKYKE